MRTLTSLSLSGSGHAPALTSVSIGRNGSCREELLFCKAYRPAAYSHLSRSYMLERVYYWLKIQRFKMPPCIVASQFTPPFEPQNILLNCCYPSGPGMAKILPPEPVSSSPAGTYPVLRHMMEFAMDVEQPEMSQKSRENEDTCNMDSSTIPSSFQSSLVLSLFYSPLEDEEDDNDDSSEDWWSEDEMEESSKTKICSDGNNSRDLENYQEVEEEDSIQQIVFENLGGALSMNSQSFHPLCFSKPIQAHTDLTTDTLKPKNHQETLVSSYRTRASSKLEESCHLPKQPLPREDQKVDNNQETYLCCQPSPGKNASPIAAEIPLVSQQEIQVKKKVRFSPVVTVHSLVVWDYASRAARRGPWEEMARDRCRFQRRISQMAAILEPCLTVDHRHKVWKRIYGVSMSLLEEAADNVPLCSGSTRKEKLGLQS
ncbi:protein phosphatase 1 regulatory subunit 15A [Crotalus adamanteus]|uniref:Protein phosphatase 1 regulatory subunit 15A n=1 Tax=Crotalus adamanteus TaxID=8729 RepID=A0AAW1B728_CROAD